MLLDCVRGRGGSCRAEGSVCENNAKAATLVAGGDGGDEADRRAGSAFWCLGALVSRSEVVSLL